MLSTYTVDIVRKYSLPQIQFSQLDLSSCSITLINEIPTKILFISSLNLDNNLLQSLSGIQQFMNLERLSVNFNFISNIYQLKKINNKFLIKELSYIGNPIQNSITIKQLKSQGFSNLNLLNDIKSIAQLSNTKSFAIKQNHQNSKNYSFNQSFSNNKNNHHYLNQSNRFQQSNIPSSTERYQTEHNLNQTMKNSQFVYLTKRQQSVQPNKRQKDFQSTGDTKKRKLSSFRAIQNSRYRNSQNSRYRNSQNSKYRNSQNPNYRNSQQSSPNFNHYYPNEKSLQDNYRQSLPNRKVTQFNLYPVDQQINLYPVDQQMTRSRNLQNVQYQQIRNYRTSSNEDQSIPSNSFKKIKQLHKTLNYNKRINPFQQTQQIQYPISQQQRYRPYRSQRYQINNNKINSQSWENQEQEQQEYYRNNNNAFQLIQKQIPIYKEAIAIAFYYRNLLQKVFRGFQFVMGKQIRLKSQSSQNTHSNQKKTNHSNQQDRSRFITESQENIQNVQQRQLFKQKQIELLRYAWMKIQLYSNYQKVISKYSLSYQKHT